MYKILQEWADKYDPLTLEEQRELVYSIEDEEYLAELLIKHSSRMILSVIHKWYRTFDDKDDIAMLAMQGAMTAYSTCNFDKYLFGTHCSLCISSLLHRRWRKYAISAELVDNGISGYHDEYSDLKDVILQTMRDVLTDSEYDFMYNIYFNHLTIANAGKLYGFSSPASSSRKKTAILAKLKDNLPDSAVLYLIEGEDNNNA